MIILSLIRFRSFFQLETFFTMSFSVIFYTMYHCNAKHHQVCFGLWFTYIGFYLPHSPFPFFLSLSLSLDRNHFIFLKMWSLEQSQTMYFNIIVDFILSLNTKRKFLCNRFTIKLKTKTTRIDFLSKETKQKKKKFKHTQEKSCRQTLRKKVFFSFILKKKTSNIHNVVYFIQFLINFILPIRKNKIAVI